MNKQLLSSHDTVHVIMKPKVTAIKWIATDNNLHITVT